MSTGAEGEELLEEEGGGGGGDGARVLLFGEGDLARVCFTADSGGGDTDREAMAGVIPDVNLTGVTLLADGLTFSQVEEEEDVGVGVLEIGACSASGNRECSEGWTGTRGLG